MGLRIGWGPVAAEMRVNRSERELLHPLFVVLRDKRALLPSAPASIDAGEAHHSIEEIRADLTFALKELGPDAAVAGELEVLRRSCRDYLHSADEARRNGSDYDFAAALCRLQVSFREVVGAIAMDYDLPSAGELAQEMEQGSLSTDLSRVGPAQIPASGAVDPEDCALWSIEQLGELERLIDVETIWIVGRDFATDLPDMPFHAVIRRNVIERNVKYAYVAPDTQPVCRQLERLKSALQLPNPSRLQAFFLDAERWSELPYTAGNFTIYDPLRRGKSPMGYFWYPGANGEMFGRLGDYVVADWVNTMLAICPPLALT